MYTLNFEKIKQTSIDFKGKDWYNPKDIIKGIYWNKNEISMYSENAESIMENITRLENETKWQYLPILYIDESVNNHMTQILFILKENFSDIELGFTGWKSFSKENLITLCKEDYDIYKNDWPNGTEFVSKFPDEINHFLECYCDKAMITSNPITIL